MKNSKAFANMKFSRWQLWRFILRGGLQVEVEVDYAKQTLNWQWIDPRKSKWVKPQPPEGEK